jgi:hypothetical protein
LETRVRSSLPRCHRIAGAALGVSRGEIRTWLEAAILAQRDLGVSCHVARALPKGSTGEDALSPAPC